MYRAFQLDFSTFNVNTLEKHYRKGKEIYESQRKRMHESLSRYIDPDGNLDGKMIEEDWFPQSDFGYNVFLSHSHKDEQWMIAFAGYLKNTFDLNCFIDSQLWGYIGDLQHKMDEKCCRFDPISQTWNYNDRNVSTSYVHNMLVVALAKMMDSTECFFFAKTPASLISTQVSQTLSPWIYTELSIARLLRPRAERKEEVLLLESDGFLHAYCNKKHGVVFTPPSDYLINLSWYDIKDWEGLFVRNRLNPNHPFPLDVLYRIKGVFERT